MWFWTSEAWEGFATVWGFAKSQINFPNQSLTKNCLNLFSFLQKKSLKSRSLVPTFETETWQSFRFPDKSGVYLESTCLTNQIFLLFLTNSEQLRFSTTKRRVTWYQISRPKLTVFRESFDIQKANRPKWNKWDRFPSGRVLVVSSTIVALEWRYIRQCLSELPTKSCIHRVL